MLLEPLPVKVDGRLSFSLFCTTFVYHDVAPHAMSHSYSRHVREGDIIGNTIQLFVAMLIFVNCVK